MKFNIKKIVASTLLSSIIFTTACGSAGEAVSLMSFRNTDYQSVITMIDSISEASLETESAIEAAYVAYSGLEDGAKESVSNAERLFALREEVADLYEDTSKQGNRVDRSKILIGTYCVNFWDDSHIKEVAECGIDFIAAAGYSQEFMDTLAKYDIGAFVSCGNFGYPMWKGGDRDYGTTVSGPSFTVEDFAASGNVVDHEAIWGIELVDEPHSDDMYFHGALADVLIEKHPEYQVYCNLFPSYAGSHQLGTLTYEEHVEDYLENFNLDYISYDFYMYDGKGSNNTQRVLWDKAIDNMRIVANACRDNNKDYWIVIQANHPDARFFTSTDQLRMQANTALAFGATVINWACWNPGWFYNNIVDSNGNKTEQYDKVKLVNEETATLSPAFMKYKYVDANILGAKQIECKSFYKKDDNVIKQDVFIDVSMSEKATSSVLSGYFEKRQGEGSAMMFVNITDPLCEEKALASVTFKVADANAVVTEYTAAGARVLKPNADGYYEISVENAAYCFVTVE